MENIDFSQFFWIFKPKEQTVTSDAVVFTTEPETDFWQRTYYGFRNDNAHTFVTTVHETEFTFEVKASCKPVKTYDQCGIVIYQDSDNWVKASLEYDGDNISRLGSVVTNLGYSDWASTEVDASLEAVYYRLSRRGQDFCIETSLDGKEFALMRIFHMHNPLPSVNVGIYGCSPLQSSTSVDFSELLFSECKWELYRNPDL